jgi:hypothetical protein
LRRNGPSKEHRKDPIVQMGLLLDNRGCPSHTGCSPETPTTRRHSCPSLRR